MLRFSKNIFHEYSICMISNCLSVCLSLSLSLYIYIYIYSNYKIDENTCILNKPYPKKCSPNQPTKKSKTYHLLQQIKNLQPNYFQ